MAAAQASRDRAHLAKSSTGAPTDTPAHVPQSGNPRQHGRTRAQGPMQPDGDLEWLTLQRSKVPRRPFAIVATYSCGDEVHAFVPLIGTARGLPLREAIRRLEGRGLLLRMSGRFTASDSAPGACPVAEAKRLHERGRPALGAEDPNR